MLGRRRCIGGEFLGLGMDCGFEWERDGHVELSFMERRGELLPMIDGHVEYVNEEVVIASVPLMSEAWKDRG